MKKYTSSELIQNKNFIENLTLTAKVQHRSIIEQIKDLCSSANLITLKQRCNALKDHDKNKAKINHYILRKKVMLWAMLWAIGSWGTALLNWNIICALIFLHPLFVFPGGMLLNPSWARATFPFAIVYLVLYTYCSYC